MKIEEGMYIRTDKGIIKATSDEYDFKDGTTFDNDRDVDLWYGDVEIIGEPSYKITDLLEIGDLVELEYYVAKYRKRISRLFQLSFTEDYIFFENKHCDFTFARAKCERKFIMSKGYNVKIKAVLTHEQIEQNQYKVEVK